ncbi:MAG: 16S rRNA processing protein RimM [Coriobacteriia bacterium]|nr:16S rRNA processing protein RimM [Coriobacteriia bacterium]
MQVALVPPVLDAPRFVTVEDAQPTGLDGGVVWFEEIDDVSVAEMVVGCHCLVRREDLPEHTVMLDDSTDIAGWPVTDVRAGSLGIVAEIREMPGQMMLVVERPDGSELLVPLVDEFLSQVDEESEQLVVDLPAGLLDL